MVNALSCAILDEFTMLDQVWDVGCAGDEERAEDILAPFLKKIARQTEKTLLLRALSSTTVKRKDEDQDTSGSLEEQCARLEAQIAAEDLQIAKLTQDLHSEPNHMQIDQHPVLNDLMTRLPTSVGREEATLSPSMTNLGSGIEQCIQDLVPAHIACQRLLAERQESLAERERAVCAAAKFTPAARDVLSNLQ
jgi:hypothetical protein